MIFYFMLKGRHADIAMRTFYNTFIAKNNERGVSFFSDFTSNCALTDYAYLAKTHEALLKEVEFSRCRKYERCKYLCKRKQCGTRSCHKDFNENDHRR